MGPALLHEAMRGGVYLADEARTVELGSGLGSVLRPPDVLLLDGPLGAGKTCLVRGILRNMGIVGPVRSPTFNLMVEYEVGFLVVHADFYRLASAAGTGIEDVLGDALCLIEWPDRLEDLVDPRKCWQVEISRDGEGRRAWVHAPEGWSGLHHM